MQRDSSVPDRADEAQIEPAAADSGVTFVFTSGESQPLELDVPDRRFFVVDAPVEPLAFELRQGESAWPRALVRAEMLRGNMSRRRAKKVLARRAAATVRYATMRLPGGGLRLIACRSDGHIDLTAAQCASLAQYLLSLDGR